MSAPTTWSAVDAYESIRLNESIRAHSLPDTYLVHVDMKSVERRAGRFYDHEPDLSLGMLWVPMPPRVHFNRGDGGPSCGYGRFPIRWVTSEHWRVSCERCLVSPTYRYSRDIGRAPCP